MQTAYFVNRVSVHKQPMDIVVAGEPSRQAVDQVEVELVDPTGQHGTITRRYHKPSEIAWAKVAFVQGATVTLDDSPVAVAEPVAA
nr:hypothetical protein [uncultured Rhodopila sp.]